MKRWRVDDDAPVPIEVECEQRGYPHKDAEGHTQYDNTYFDTEDEAWKQAQRNAEAFVRLAASSVKQAEAKLASAREYAADAAKFMKAFLDGRDARDLDRE